jgi:uncharacterized phosphatase
MTSLYLVRHGETDWNAQRRIQGATDIPLNDTGREQARTTGLLLARREWDGIFSSPLSRALETATIIAAETRLGEVEVIPDLAERNYGDAEGLNYQEIEVKFPGDTVVPGRETHESVGERAVAVLMALARGHQGQSLIVVSHGGLIRSVLNVVDPGAKHGSITNGSVHSFELVDGALELIEFDDPIDEESLECGTDDLDEQNAIEGRDAVRS